MAETNLLLNYVGFSSIYLLAVALNLLVLVGLFYWPFEFGIYFLIPYLTYTKVLARSELRQGCRVHWFSEKFFLFNIMRNYLQMSFYQPLPKALVEAEKAEGAKFIFAFFPHGTSSDYRILMDGMLKDIFPHVYNKTRTLAASVLFMIPVVREMAIATGCISASRQVAEAILDNGYSIIVLPGGEAEQIRTVHQKEKIYLKKRKGFIKLAMRKGVPVVPAYVFGVNDYYRTTGAFFSLRLWLQKRLGVCIPLISGLWGSIFCPLPIKTTIVLGDPITFQVLDKHSPTDEELDMAHAQFCKALLGLFDSHKHELGYSDRSLEVI